MCCVVGGILIAIAVFAYLRYKAKKDETGMSFSSNIGGGAKSGMTMSGAVQFERDSETVSEKTTRVKERSCDGTPVCLCRLVLEILYMTLPRNSSIRPSQILFITHRMTISMETTNPSGYCLYCLCYCCCCFSFSCCSAASARCSYPSFVS